MDTLLKADTDRCRVADAAHDASHATRHEKGLRVSDREGRHQLNPHDRPGWPRRSG
jgi:hypothetical protein